MRFLYAFTALGIGCLLSLTSEEARGCDPPFYGRAVYYPPMPVYYYQPYYAPPMYYQPSYAPRYPQMRPGMSVSIGAYDNYFEPKTVNVQPGTTVRWVNYGKHVHTATSNDGRWDSGDIPPGAAYSVTFQTPGTYYYYCRHHTKEKMQGTIIVGGAGGGYGSARPSGY